MKIYNSKQLKTLQKEFSDRFPFLKIEFFKNPHPYGVNSGEVEKLDAELTVGDVRKMENVGKLTMDGDLPVGVFEKILEERFGLFVQVYRNSYGKWLQTWVTDIWTLEEQNNRGKVLSQDTRPTFNSVNFNTFKEWRLNRLT